MMVIIKDFKTYSKTTCNSAGNTSPGLFFRYCSFLIFFFIGIGQSPLEGQNPMFPSPDTRAVIVGISDYQNISDLDYAHRDAMAMAEYLQSPAGGSVPAENIRLLVNEEATQMQFAMALDWLQEESKDGDRAFIYFSGHGDVEKKTARQRGFLLTYDAPATTYMAGGAFPIIFLQDIIGTMSTDQGVEVVLIADACRAGKLAGDGIGGNHVTAEVMAEAFAREIKILSCQPKQLSQEGEQWGGGRGVFSYHLIEGLTGLANRGEDEEVNVLEIRRYLEDQVSMATGGEQLPLVVGSSINQLAKVDAEALRELLEKNSVETMANTLVLNDKKPGAADPDSVIWKLYQDFLTALKEKHLLYPKQGSAYAIYQRIKDEASIQSYQKEMKRDLAVAFHDEAQQAINDYLIAPAEELQNRWSYNERYDHYPEFLGKAAELLGPDHYMYDDLKTRQLYFEGLQLRLKGEREKEPRYFQEALQKQKLVVQRDSSAAYGYNELGILHRRLKQQKEATGYFYQANDHSPTWVLPMANLITNYTELGQFDSAFAVGARALEVDPAFALTYHNLGYAYEVAKKWEPAAQNYQKAIQLDPEYAGSYYNLGFVYFYLDQLDSTEYYFLQFAEKLKREAAFVWSDLGFVAARLQKEEDAMKYFEKAISIDPEFPGTYFNLGDFQFEKGRLEEAEEAYLKYLQLVPDRQIVHYNLAAVLARKGEAEKALERLEVAIDKGFDKGEQLKNDEHFKSLRQLPRFQELLQRIYEE